MRLASLLFLMFFIQISTVVFSQTTTFSFKLENKQIVEVLKEIEETSRYRFFYVREQVDVERLVSVRAKNAKIEDILNKLFIGLDINYQVMEDHLILLSPEDISFEKAIKTVEKELLAGNINDEFGVPIPGVNVFIKGTTHGTISDSDGNFSISNISKKDILTFSFLGMNTQEVLIGDQNNINVTLTIDAFGIEEVVALGYGKIKKRDFTGSTSSISPEKLLDRPVHNVGQAIQNKIAGVQVIKQGGGVPGSNPLIRIRGTNSINTSGDPLFVVDGIVGVKNALSALNTADILTFDVLKDASATAIYGTRGANGVIIIETKRGIKGKTQVSYSGSVSVATMRRHNYIMNADQLMYVYEQAMANGAKYGTINNAKDFRGGKGSSLSYSEMPWLFEQVPEQSSYILDLVGNDGNYYKPRYDSNWESEIFNTAFSQNHHIDVHGGNEKSTFSISLGAINQNGLMLESYFNRFNTKIAGDINVNKWLDLSSSISLTKSKQSDDNGITRPTAEVWSIVPERYPNKPEFGIYAGRWGTNADFNVGEQWYNVLFMRNQDEGHNNRIQAMGSLNLHAKITENLSYKTDFSVDYNSRAYKRYDGIYYGKDGIARAHQFNQLYWQNQNYFNYKKTFADHSLIGMLGASWSQDNYDNVEAENRDFFTNFYQYNNLSVGARSHPDVDSNNGESSLNSYFARGNYGYKEKYLLTLTGRYDGSSKFGVNSKYGFFPSVGAAWRIDQENFISDKSDISNLKIRASAGQTGNQEIGSYVTQQYIAATNVVLGGNFRTGIYPSSVGNPSLRWETTTQYDVGFDLGLFKNRVNMTLDVYHKLTTDMLLDVPLPTSTSNGKVTLNYGSIQNSGFEIDLNTCNVYKTNLNWNTHITISSNRNEIIELGPTGADIFVNTSAGNGTSIFREGEPVGSFFGLNRIGVYGTNEATLAARYGMLPGDLKFEDVNQDGKIDLKSDGNIIGNSFPKLWGGINNTLQYKNFDSSLDIQVVLGVDKAIVHESAEDRQLVSGGVNTVLDAWRPDNQDAIIAQIRPGSGGAYYQSYPDTHMIYNGAFIRGSAATLGYSLSENMINKLGLSKVRLYLSAENFFLLTAEELPGYDPEGSSLDKIDVRVPNIDKYQYPMPTTYSLGINVSL
jgi:TonB-linked SusC/RagA family outer membrane protein